MHECDPKPANSRPIEPRCQLRAKIKAKANLRLVAPDSGLRTVTLRRRSNSEMGRDREHLTEREVECLIKAAKGNRHGHRDATMILIGFRHGLRVSELCSLQWSSIEFETGTIYVRRAKGGQEATHPLLGDELRALRELKRQSASPFVFASQLRLAFDHSED
jgi:integrase